MFRNRLLGDWEGPGELADRHRAARKAPQQRTARRIGEGAKSGCERIHNLKVVNTQEKASGFFR